MTESALQSLFHKTIWNKYKNTRYLCYHIPNQAKRTGHAFMIAMGMIPGMPDYACMFPAQGYKGLYIEFKSSTGKLSDNQIKVHAALRAHGFMVAVVDNFNFGIKVFLDYAKGTDYLQE